MGTKILGILASIAVIALIAVTFLHRDRYRSLLPERAVRTETFRPAENAVPEEAVLPPDTAIVADTLRTMPDNNL